MGDVDRRAGRRPRRDARRLTLGLSTEGPAPLARLVAELSRLPGIGQRTAQRLAFHLLRAPDEEAFALGEAIREVKEKVGLCEQCFNLAEGPLCRICADESATRRRSAWSRSPAT